MRKIISIFLLGVMQSVMFSRFSCGAQVDRDVALLAAQTTLPSFFPGSWTPVDELDLHLPSGGLAVYVFVFEKENTRDGLRLAAGSPSPSDFVIQARQAMEAEGQTVSGREEPLYGLDRYATIYISADDSEPPVLRCFEGLPTLLVRSENALQRAGRQTGSNGWRIHRLLMTGLFDETYELEHQDLPGDSLVVELRSATVRSMTETERKRHAVKPAEDSERQRLSRKAWDRYRKGGQP